MNTTAIGLEAKEPLCYLPLFSGGQACELFGRIVIIRTHHDINSFHE
jgi:hypothetical protein